MQNMNFKVIGTVATLKGDDVLNPNRVVYKEIHPVLGMILILTMMGLWGAFCWHWIGKFYAWAGLFGG